MAFKLTPTQKYYDLQRILEGDESTLSDAEKQYRATWGGKTMKDLTIKQELGDFYQYDPAYLTSSDRAIMKYKVSNPDPFSNMYKALDQEGGVRGYASGYKNVPKPNKDIYGSLADYRIVSMGLPSDINSVNARIAKRGAYQQNFTDEQLADIINGKALDNPDQYKMVDYHMQARDFMLKQIDDLENKTIATREKYLGASGKIEGLNKEVSALNEIVNAQNAEVDKFTKNKEETKRLKAAARAVTQGIKRK